MLEQGKTPPGIRTDINDKPANPRQEPSDSRMRVRPKPWEMAAPASPASASSSAVGAAGAGGAAIEEIGSPYGAEASSSSSAAAPGPSGSGSGSGWRPPPPPKSRFGNGVS